jgi:hypothetical protein
MNKKSVLDILFYDIGKQQFDFYVAGTYIKDGEKHFTKWKKYSEAAFPIEHDGTCKDDYKKQNFFEHINQRQIFPNELVLDIEEKEKAKPIIEKLEEWKWEYSIWETGSRGFHIHILFPEKITQKKKEVIVKSLETDLQKCSDKCLIALENCPHWKTGNIKKEISKEVILNGK